MAAMIMRRHKSRYLIEKLHGEGLEGKTKNLRIYGTIHNVADLKSKEMDAEDLVKMAKYPWVSGTIHDIADLR